MTTPDDEDVKQFSEDDASDNDDKTNSAVNDRPLQNLESVYMGYFVRAQDFYLSRNFLSRSEQMNIRDSRNSLMDMLGLAPKLRKIALVSYENSLDNGFGMLIESKYQILQEIRIDYDGSSPINEHIIIDSLIKVVNIKTLVLEFQYSSLFISLRRTH